MDWIQVLTIIFGNLGIFLWIRTESRNDMREFSADMRNDMKIFSSEIRQWKEEINHEMKDFHGRLCAIEERNKIG
jgi:hypothetical protein